MLLLLIASLLAALSMVIPVSAQTSNDGIVIPEVDTSASLQPADQQLLDSAMEQSAASGEIEFNAAGQIRVSGEGESVAFTFSATGAYSGLDGSVGIEGVKYWVDATIGVIPSDPPEFLDIEMLLSDGIFFARGANPQTGEQLRWFSFPLSSIIGEEILTILDDIETTPELMDDVLVSGLTLEDFTYSRTLPDSSGLVHFQTEIDLLGFVQSPEFSSMLSASAEMASSVAEMPIEYTQFAFLLMLVRPQLYIRIDQYVDPNTSLIDRIQLDFDAAIDMGEPAHIEVDLTVDIVSHSLINPIEPPADAVAYDNLDEVNGEDLLITPTPP